MRFIQDDGLRGAQMARQIAEPRHGELVVGSSPRERGTRHRREVPAAAWRFIPARAENTRTIPAASTARPVHPRASGEHVENLVGGSRHVGSSPRERGTRLESGVVLGLGRFIPARAGNTMWDSASVDRMWVHPRASGEHVYTTNYEQLPWRFIPARAGNTMTPNSACGSTFGSSPRERGTRRARRKRPRRPRFIPARAGNTSLRLSAAWRPTVHPRASGEHFSGSRTGSPDDGSSPRERGTQQVQVIFVRFHRFIPARAGNTTWESPASLRVAVHPRASGEHRG